MQQHIDLGPVEISYAAALRGVRPKGSSQSFRYIRAGRMDADEMLCLAASNPEGEFLFIDENASQAAEAQRRARDLHLANAEFIGMSLAKLEDALAAGTHFIAAADYFCVDLSYDVADNASYAHQLAGSLVRPGGLFVIRYAPFASARDSLHFMTAEFAPELKPSQHTEFLHELKQLGHAYFAQHPEDSAALDNALGAQNPEKFLNEFAVATKPQSRTIATLASMVPQKFAFVGDARFSANYLEMMVPKPSQEILYSLRGHLLYEVIKDFSAAHAFRTDIWIRQPGDFTGDLAQLYGNFFYGLTDMTGPVPETIMAGGQSLDLSAPILAALLKFMHVMPLTVGDFLDHPDGREFKPLDVVMAVQMLVACGIAAPMRGSFAGLGQIDYRYPRLAGLFNQQLRAEPLHGMSATLASTVAGRPVKLELPEALVLQAVGRVGFEESAGALMTELQRVAGNPAQARLVFPFALTPEHHFAESMIRRVCERNIVNWYALGVLDAA
ncbi:MAG: methyltransferase regulatory domain-containing protein [Alphaproteobacteria bacterium]